MAINFFQEDIRFDLPQKRAIKRWLMQLAVNEGYGIKALNYIFCSDEYLYHINREYLNHDTFTDIITFDNSDGEQTIEGDIFISIDRVKENSKNHNAKFEDELKRVLCHGLLHLVGYRDKTPAEQIIMRQKEDNGVRLFHQSNTQNTQHVPRGTDDLNH